ncbi:hypothetical protein GCM10009777_18370 [Microbacterium pumilum]|uniref:Beta-lactamase class A catalytic domain-containing protein n=1 Tax=Microbacterium pumilum TaxID=344165 RepID=A0ABN2SDB7_9MICO
MITEGTYPVRGIIAAAVTGTLDAPLLYVQRTAIPGVVQTELRRLAPQRIVVIGGTDGVSDAVMAALKPYAATVSRVAGANRYGTSQAAMASLGRQFTTVYVASGANDLLSPLAAAAAARTDRGMLLVDGLRTAADAATIAALRGVNAQSVVIVGPATRVSTSYEASLRAAGFVVKRLSGTDRYTTAILLAKESGVAPQRAITVNSLVAAAVPIAAALASATHQPLLYVLQECAPDSIAAYLASARLPMTAVGAVSSVGTDTLAGRSCSAVKAQREFDLLSAIRATAAQYAGTYQVTVRQLGGMNETVSLSGGLPHEPASMMKIFAAWAALKLVEQKRANLYGILPSGVPLNVCIHTMIHVSDNYCHSDIVHWIGIANINSMIRSAGFTGTYYGTVAPGVSVLYAGNRTTTNDLAKMMSQLVGGSALSRSWSDYLLNEMRGQIWRSRIASGIPPRVDQASKPGALWLTSGLLQADTAVVWSNKGTYALSIIGDNGPPQAALRAISRTVYEHFNGAFGAAASYPVQQMVTVEPTWVRASPGGTVVTTAPSGTPIQVLDAVRDWYLIKWGTRELYMHYSALRNR